MTLVNSFSSYCVRLQYMPPVDSRAVSGFVGLKNAGATCYMNALIQQLYMTPGIAEYILSIDDEHIDEDRSVETLSYQPSQSVSLSSY